MTRPAPLRQLSAIIHPDKVSDPQASDAFQGARPALPLPVAVARPPRHTHTHTHSSPSLFYPEVKRAYEALIDEEERKRVHGILQQSRQKVLRERKRLKKKGVEEKRLPPLKEQLQVETMKVRGWGAGHGRGGGGGGLYPHAPPPRRGSASHARAPRLALQTFATAEHRRQKAIQLKQEYRKRERTAEDDEKQAEREKREVEKAWARGRCVRRVARGGRAAGR